LEKDPTSVDSILFKEARIGFRKGFSQKYFFIDSVFAGEFPSFLSKIQNQYSLGFFANNLKSNFQSDTWWSLKEALQKIKSPKNQSHWLVIDVDPMLPIERNIQILLQLRKSFDQNLVIRSSHAKGYWDYFLRLSESLEIPLWWEGEFGESGFEYLHFVTQSGFAAKEDGFEKQRLSPVIVSDPIGCGIEEVFKKSVFENPSLFNDFRKLFDSRSYENWNYWPLFLKESAQGKDQLLRTAEVEWMVFQSFSENSGTLQTGVQGIGLNLNPKIFEKSFFDQRVLEDWDFSTDATEALSLSPFVLVRGNESGLQVLAISEAEARLYFSLSKNELQQDLISFKNYWKSQWQDWDFDETLESMVIKGLVIKKPDVGVGLQENGQESYLDL
jgi:hypothetical protein